MTSGGDSACSRKSGYRAFTPRNRSSYHSMRQVRIVPALQQQLSAAEPNRLLDLRVDLVEAERVALARSDRPVERAELAARDADVRVVHVAVDDVGDRAFRDASRAARRRPAGRAAPSARPGRACARSPASAARRPRYAATIVVDGHAAYSPLAVAPDQIDASKNSRPGRRWRGPARRASR